MFSTFHNIISNLIMNIFIFVIILTLFFIDNVFFDSPSRYTLFSHLTLVIYVFIYYMFYVFLYFHCYLFILFIV